MASEIKNLRNPPDEVVQVIITVADFVDGQPDLHTWNSAKAKMYDFIRRGVGLKERVSDDRFEILRRFVATGITPERVKSKSTAAAHFAIHLLTIYQLQEHLMLLDTSMDSIPPVAAINFSKPVEEELGIDGRPKHRFYNDELENKTHEI